MLTVVLSMRGYRSPPEFESENRPIDGDSTCNRAKMFRHFVLRFQKPKVLTVLWPEECRHAKIVCSSFNSVYDRRTIDWE
jgi:hypothetical protein